MTPDDLADGGSIARAIRRPAELGDAQSRSALDEWRGTPDLRTAVEEGPSPPVVAASGLPRVLPKDTCGNPERCCACWNISDHH
jgi:hypothetical protein